MSETLQDKLRQARAALEESQSQFAKRLAVPLSTFIKWENNQRTPRGYALTALNEALDKILRK